MRDNGSTTSAQPDFFRVWLSGQVPAFNAWMAVNRTLVRGTGEAMADWSAFLLDRWRQDLALQNRLAQCRGPDEVQQSLTAFGETALVAYQGEMQRLGALANKLAGELAHDMKATTTNSP